MKILMIAGQFHPVVGGTERECQKLAARLIARGIQVTVLTQHREGLPDYEVIEGIPVYRRMKGWHWYEYTYMLSVLSFLLRYRRTYDVIHCFGLYLFIPPIILVKYLCGKKAIARVEGVGRYGDLYRIRQLRCRRLVLASVRKLDRIISVARHMRRELEQGGIPARKIVTIPNSVDPQVFRPGHTELRKNEICICAVGRLAEEKGIDCLIRAMPQVRRAIPACRLWIIGAGPMRALLQKLSKQLGVQELVHFIGNGSVLPLYQAAHLFVLPSRSEGLSLSLLEAMACALPVIATAVPGNKEVIDPDATIPLIPESGYYLGQYGVMCNPDDVEGLAGAIQHILQNAVAAKRLGLKAREHVAQMYALDKIASDYEVLYTSLLRRRTDAGTTLVDE